MRYLVDWGGPVLPGVGRTWRVVNPATWETVGHFQPLDVQVPCRLLNLPDATGQSAAGEHGWLEVEGKLVSNGTTGSIE